MRDLRDPLLGAPCAPPTSGDGRPLLRLGALAVLLVALGAGAYLLHPSPASVRDVADRLGAAGPLAFVAIYAALTVMLVPGTASTLLAGALFGPLRGTALAVCGATLGATAAFAVGRALGRDGVRQLVGPRAPRLEHALEQTGFAPMLVLRLLPVVPFNGLNYAAGVTGIRAPSYVAATALGILPGTAVVATAGSSLGEPTSPRFLASLLAGLSILAGSLAVHRRRRSPAAGTRADGGGAA